ncbi:hypothetical protein PFISCL1PPCAC_10220, partial [Pristionchus fissidentatus]
RLATRCGSRRSFPIPLTLSHSLASSASFPYFLLPLSSPPVTGTPTLVTCRVPSNLKCGSGMARWFRPSPLFFQLLIFFIFFTTSASNDDFFRDKLGILGLHYNLKKGYPYIQCEAWDNSSKRTVVDCGPPGSEFFGKRLGCNGVFKVKNPEKYLSMQTDELILNETEYDELSGGCWHGGEAVHQQCEHKDECVAVIRKNYEWKGIAFCCCTTHNCNSVIKVKFAPSNETFEVEDGVGWPLMNNTGSRMDSWQSTPYPGSSFNPLWFVLCILIVIVGLIACLLIVCRMTRAKTCLRWIYGERKVFDVEKTKMMGEDVPLVVVDNGRTRINLKEGLEKGDEIAQGKMGTVHKGTYKDPDTGKERLVAIKTIKDQKSFLMEEAAYRVCNNGHDHLLHFIGSCSEPQFNLHYVVLELQENGCLENYLKEESFTPLEALTFLSSFMDGLSFLHSPSNLPMGGYKNTIVHRDIKSRNILVKADKRAAIADLGLAMICEGSRPQGRYYQVGTHRYMSPELLLGCSNLNIEGLKMADVYAAALIVWEVLNRTKVNDEDEILPAQLPYAVEVEQFAVEAENEFKNNNVDPSKTFDRKPIQYYLKTVVHTMNRRPELRERLKSHPITSELVRTTVDMWDDEVDGRISAPCAHARLKQLRMDAINGTIPQPIT